MERIRVVLSAAVTWLIFAAFVISAILEQVATFAGIPPQIATALSLILAAIAAAVAVIRRVTEVLPAARGLIAKPGQPNTDLEAIGVARLRSAIKAGGLNTDIAERMDAAAGEARIAARPVTRQFPGEFP